MKKEINEYGMIIITAIVIGIVTLLLLANNGWLDAIGKVADSNSVNNLEIMQSREKPKLIILVNDASINVGSSLEIAKGGYAIDNDYYTLYAASSTDKETLIDGTVIDKNLTHMIKVSCDQGDVTIDEETGIEKLVFTEPGSYELTFSITETSEESDEDGFYFASATKTIILTVI